MVAEKVNHKRRMKRNIEASIAHIHSIFNNTTTMITDTHGNALAWSSAGSLGSGGNKKSTPSAAQMVAETVTKATMEHGLKTVEVTVRGPGSGRETATCSLQATGLEVTATRDVTLVPYNGAYPLERHRV